MQRYAIIVLALFCLLAGVAAPAGAAWPERPLRLIVLFPPGGGSDTLCRLLAPLLEKELGQRVMVNNMPGAAGATGLAYVWNAPHDGYTLASISEPSLLAPITTGITAIARRWVPFLGATTPCLLAVNKESGIRSIQEFLHEAKNSPTSLKIAVNTMNIGHWHVTMLTGTHAVPLKLVTYGGIGPAIQACASGETEAILMPAGDGINYLRAGAFVPLAVTTQEIPFELGGQYIPTLLSVLPGWKHELSLQSFQGIIMPADAPVEARDRMAAAFAQAMRSPEMKAFFACNPGFLPLNLTGEEAARFIQAHESKAAWLMRDLGLAKHSPESLGIPKPE